MEFTYIKSANPTYLSWAKSLAFYEGQNYIESISNCLFYNNRTIVNNNNESLFAVSGYISYNGYSDFESILDFKELTQNLV